MIILPRELGFLYPGSPQENQIGFGLDQRFLFPWIGEAVEQVAYEFEMRRLLVVGFDDAPRTLLMTGSLQHLIAGVGIGVPLLQRQSIDVRILPGFQWVPLARH